MNPALHMNSKPLIYHLMFKERERSSAFQAVGLLAVAVKLEISPHLPKILEFVRQSLPHKELPHK